MISKVQSAQWRLGSGAFTSGGVIPRDGAFDEQTAEGYTFTPSSAVAAGVRTFGTRSTNNFGHTSPIRSDTLTVR